jgi:valyl-tRNA synthetase
VARELDKSYEHLKVEPKWYPKWLEMGVFRARDESDKPPFCLVIPPPNVTGALHMGHGLTYAIQDCIIRWKRMCGYNTLWLPGTDHAGIATQMLVERKLAAEGLSREGLGREAFLEKVWEWKGQYHGRITEQSRRMGISVDWERERFTLDEGLSRAVREAFVQLHEQGLIYRARRMVNWSCAIRTVLSDLEVEHRDVKGHFWHLAYPVVGDPSRKVVVATTRPETMLGDTAVAVHSTDERYRDLIGKRVHLPLTDRTIPVIADDILADPTKGTGAVKVTPAHDPNDFECGLRNNLDFVDILNDDASLNDNAPQKYRGLDRFKAREAVVGDLNALGLIERIEEIVHPVGHCMRSGSMVEPKVSWQWYVKMGPAEDPGSIAGAAIKAVEDGRIRFIPPHWNAEYFRWLYNIRDWCISRQLWWGHRIPAWHCARCGQVTVARQDPDRCVHCGAVELRQDEDVLDTWFSSGLWPFSTLGWPEDTRAMRTFYPNAIMETGFDIIFFWVARMIMMGLRLPGDVPFKEVYLHAMVRDAAGQKMSKTKGNVVDPLEVCEEHGADALRFSLLALTVQGRDIKLSKQTIAGYRAFMNKLWNSARFVLMNLPDDDVVDPGRIVEKLSVEDRWILTRLQKVVGEVTAALAGYRFNEYALTLYQFAWHEFCDWYVELAKPSLYGEDEEAKKVTRSVLTHVLRTILECLHPAAPFITEEIWQMLPGRRGDTICTTSFPQVEVSLRFEEEAAAFVVVIDTIAAIRSIRSQNNVPPSAPIEVVVRPNGEVERGMLEWGRGFLTRLARLGGLTIDLSAERPAQSGTAVTSFATVFVKLGGLVDIEAEKQRIGKQRDKLREKLQQIERKLESPVFLEKAAAAVIAEQEEKRTELRAKLQALDAHLESLGGQC